MGKFFYRFIILFFISLILSPSPTSSTDCVELSPEQEVMKINRNKKITLIMNAPINEINYNDLIYSISKAKSPSCLSEIRIPIEFTL